MSITARQNKARALVLRHAPAVTRPTDVRLATASVLAGIAISASAGTAAAAPAAPLPTFTGTSSLEALLLNGREAGSLLGARRLVEVKSGNRLSSGTIEPSECTGAYAPYAAAAYTDTDVEDVAFNVVSDGTDTNLIVSEAVVQLAGKREALAHMKVTANAWADCKGMTITSGEGQDWVLGAPWVNEDRTIVTLSQTAANGGGTCERAIAAYRDIFIDVMSCSSGRAEGQAAKITQAIADKADDQWA